MRACTERVAEAAGFVCVRFAYMVRLRQRDSGPAALAMLHSLRCCLGFAIGCMGSLRPGYRHRGPQMRGSGRLKVR